VINLAFVPDYNGFPLFCLPNWNPAAWRLGRSFQPESEKYPTKLIDVCRAVPESSQPINRLQQKTPSTQNSSFPTTTNTKRPLTTDDPSNQPTNQPTNQSDLQTSSPRPPNRKKQLQFSRIQTPWDTSTSVITISIMHYAYKFLHHFGLILHP
jgi:hypothetical protein